MVKYKKIKCEKLGKKELKYKEQSVNISIT